VLTATFFSYGKAKNSTPHRVETFELIGIKFGAVDYVREATSCPQFYALYVMQPMSPFYDLCFLDVLVFEVYKLLFCTFM